MQHSQEDGMTGTVVTADTPLLCTAWCLLLDVFYFWFVGIMALSCVSFRNFLGIPLCSNICHVQVILVFLCGYTLSISFALVLVPYNSCRRQASQSYSFFLLQFTCTQFKLQVLYTVLGCFCLIVCFKGAGFRCNLLK